MKYIYKNTCHNCEKIFEAKSSTKLYCSISCRQDFNNRMKGKVVKSDNNDFPTIEKVTSAAFKNNVSYGKQILKTETLPNIRKIEKTHLF